MVDNTSKVSYFNTLIFTIISGIVAVMLLLLLFFDMFKPYWYFIITLEVGIILVVFFNIGQIVSNEKKLTLWREKGNYSVRFDACPEYYIKEDTNCTNSYIYTDRYFNKYVMKLYPADKNLPDTTTVKNPSKIEKFDLTALDKNTKLTNSYDKCAPVFSDNYGPPNDKTLKEYSQLPWLRVRSQCEAYLK